MNNLKSFRRDRIPFDKYKEKDFLLHAYKEKQER